MSITGWRGTHATSIRGYHLPPTQPFRNLVFMKICNSQWRMYRLSLQDCKLILEYHAHRNLTWWSVSHSHSILYVNVLLDPWSFDSWAVIMHDSQRTIFCLNTLSLGILNVITTYKHQQQCNAPALAKCKYLQKTVVRGLSQKIQMVWRLTIWKPLTVVGKNWHPLCFFHREGMSIDLRWCGFSLKNKMVDTLKKKEQKEKYI